MPLPLDWPEDYEPTEAEVRAREEEFDRALEEARELVEELERRDRDFYIKYGQRFHRPVVSGVPSWFEQLWAGEVKAALAEPLPIFGGKTKPPVNEGGTATFKLKRADDEGPPPGGEGPDPVSG